MAYGIEARPDYGTAFHVPEGKASTYSNSGREALPDTTALEILETIHHFFLRDKLSYEHKVAAHHKRVTSLPRWRKFLFGEPPVPRDHQGWIRTASIELTFSRLSFKELDSRLILLQKAGFIELGDDERKPGVRHRASVRPVFVAPVVSSAQIKIASTLSNPLPLKLVVTPVSS